MSRTAGLSLLAARAFGSQPAQCRFGEWMSHRQLEYHLKTHHAVPAAAAAFRRAALFDAGETRTNSKGRFEVFVPRPDLWPHLWPKERQQQQPLWASLWSFLDQCEDCEEG